MFQKKIMGKLYLVEKFNYIDIILILY